MAARLLELRVLIPPGHGRLYLLSVVFCHLEASAADRSLLQRSPTSVVYLSVPRRLIEEV